MARMITSPSTMPAVNVLFSQIASITGALVGRKSIGLGAKEDTDVEASTVRQSQLMDFISSVCQMSERISEWAKI